MGVFRAVCGGFKCVKPGAKNKNEKFQKCALGDTFMQCVYQKIDTKVVRNNKTLYFIRKYFRFVQILKAVSFYIFYLSQKIYNPKDKTFLYGGCKNVL